MNYQPTWGKLSEPSRKKASTRPQIRNASLSIELLFHACAFRRFRFRFLWKQPSTAQGKLEERNAGYWRIVTTLDQEIPPAWVTHAARKRAKRAKANAATSAPAAIARKAADGGVAENAPPLPAVFSRKALPPPRGPFKDRVDRVFFFGDLNYRVDLSREDMELGVSVCRREEEEAEGEVRRGTRMGRRFRPGKTE